MTDTCNEQSRYTSGPSCNGGGGNRTRVPRHFSGSFYVRSRFFNVAAKDSNRRDSLTAIEERCLASSVPRMTRDDPDLTAGFWTTPEAVLSRGSRC